MSAAGTASASAPPAPLVERLCVVGVGLIGGSLARAARAAGLCREVVGAGREAASLERARALGVVDRWSLDPAEAAAGAALVVVAVPVGAMGAVFRALAPAVRAGAVLTDVGSVKAAVVATARRAFGAVPARLVPGHPIAGTERSGVEASFAELFRGQRVVLTPLAETDPGALGLVEALWRGVGATVERMSPEAHDRALAATSHLPHLLAYALVDLLAALEAEGRGDLFPYAGGGFRDFTRIASSDPALWRDICLANRGPLLELLGRYGAALEGLRRALEAGDGEALLACFARAREARDRHLAELPPLPRSPLPRSPAPRCRRPGDEGPGGEGGTR